MLKLQSRRRKRIHPIGPTWFQSGSRFAEFYKRANDQTQSVNNQNSSVENNRSICVRVHSGVEQEANSKKLVVQSV